MISDEDALRMFREGAVKGRSGEIVMPAEDTAVILVKDTTLALGDLAKYRLGELNGGKGALVVGVTGSTGKGTERLIPFKPNSKASGDGQGPEREV